MPKVPRLSPKKKEQRDVHQAFLPEVRFLADVLAPLCIVHKEPCVHIGNSLLQVVLLHRWVDQLLVSILRRLKLKLSVRYQEDDVFLLIQCVLLLEAKELGQGMHNVPTERRPVI